MTVALGLSLLAAAAAPSAASGAAGVGTDRATAAPAIIGGTKTTISERPWQVALFERDDFICGGSLLAPTVAVTAAHCVFDEIGDLKPARRFHVITGRTRLSSSAGQELGIKTIHTFKDSQGRERYDPYHTAGTSCSSSSRRLDLDADQDRRQDRARPLGRRWRRLHQRLGAINKEGSSYPDVLRTAKVQVNSDARCRSVYTGFDKDLMVCAGGGRPERDSCYGDSGGPLVAPVAGGGYRLVGDTSFGGARCGAGGVYGRLAAAPIRGSVRAKVLALSGVDVVGAGGLPVPPTIALYPLTGHLAELRALRSAEQACRKDRRCVEFTADRCKARGGHFICKIRKFIFRSLRSSRRRTLIRKLVVKESKPGGAIKAKPRGRWKKRRGWKT